MIKCPDCDEQFASAQALFAHSKARRTKRQQLIPYCDTTGLKKNKAGAWTKPRGKA